jgi:hypothetical protein
MIKFQLTKKRLNVCLDTGLIPVQTSFHPVVPDETLKFKN